MKRIGNIYSKIYDIENLREAHKNASKGKGWYEEVREINLNPDVYLYQLQDMLINKTYHTSPYVVFTRCEGGKEREISKLPYFPDRICHWAILQIIEPILINNMITDTYSAIPGRGIHYGMRRVRKALEEDPEGCRYCLKLDMRKYYPSISHDILKEKYARLIKDKDVLWLLGEIIDSTEGDTGVPIGNYLSQYSGNLYLSCLDHWVKEEKHIRHYFRYMDDIVILSDSKEQLHGLADDIKEYADRELKLKVKDNWQVFPTYTRGLDFLGYRFFGKYTLLRKTTCKSMKLRAKRVANKISGGRGMNYSDWCSMNSYHGWLMHCNAYRLSKKYITPLEPYLEKYYQENVKR